MRRALMALLPVAWVGALLVPTTYAVLYAIEAVYEVPLAAEHVRLERPWALLLLPAALLVLIAQAYVQRDGAPRILVSRGATFARGPRGVRVWLMQVPTALRVVAVALLALALTGPQSIHARDRAEIEGIDIVLTLDLSLSMQAADIRPNRFEATKAVVDDFVHRRPDDRIGAVVFGRDAYTLMPLTTDKEALRTTISELDLGMIDGRGTAIGNAVATALNRLRESQAESKVIILLTDGDSNSGNVSPDQAAEFATVMEVKVFTILMGETGETNVQRGTDLFGRPIFDRGNFPVNPELLQSMAEQTGGTYFQVSDRESLERSFHAILNELERSEIEDAGRVYGELFPAFAFPALLLLGTERLLAALLLRRWP